MSVAVLGCGPSGLAAALAAVNSGHKVLVASNRAIPSTQHGCQYLHAPIPSYEYVAHTRVGYHLVGTPEEYRLKVYGKKWKGKVSPEDFVGEHDAWDIRATYADMWLNLHANPNIEFARIPPIAHGIISDQVYYFKPDIVISTIPATDLCYNHEHKFVHHKIYANGSTKPGTEAVDTIVCDGTRENAWYRNACVFGYRTTEWAHRPTNGDMTVTVIKPLTTDCDCYPEIHRIGRYGKWQKSYLVHKAYPEVMEILNG
jgi:hypothetical protein